MKKLPSNDNAFQSFSGSYPPDDVVFLLNPVAMESTPIAEKEHLIQSGRRHYSEMITREKPPSPQYLQTFRDAVDREKHRLAIGIDVLAHRIADDRRGEIVIVSLVRAGTPIGVLLKRRLDVLRTNDAAHYSISIIRDRGVDENALHAILSRHAAKSIVFVDGWTGKGVIARELHTAITRFNHEHRTQLDEGVYVVSDLCGAAKAAASTEDFLIPSAILGATVSGLISRSILNDRVVGPGDFHACLYYKEFNSIDLSNWFVDQISAEMDRLPPHMRATAKSCAGNSGLQQKSAAFLTKYMGKHNTQDVNRVKPGVGEATRVLLRRVPDVLLLRDRHRLEVEHLVVLANEKNVPIEIDPGLPYLAAALIREVE